MATIKRVPTGMGPTFNQPRASQIQVIITGPLEVKSNDPKVRIVRKG